MGVLRGDKLNLSRASERASDAVGSLFTYETNQLDSFVITIFFFSFFFANGTECS